MPDRRIRAFISYRRADAMAEALLVREALHRVLPSSSVFLDLTAIAPGEVWPVRVQTAIANSKFIFVVIGPQSLVFNDGNPNQSRVDWLRREIATALRDPNKIIVPLLVRGAVMPEPHALPHDISGISSIQSIEVRGSHWDADIELVTKLIGPQSSIPPGVFVRTNSALQSYWPSLSPDLQDAFALAATAASRTGKSAISTRDLFAALRRLRPEPLNELLDLVPAEALPSPVSESIPSDATFLANIRSLSGCVHDSLEKLTSGSVRNKRVLPEEIFVDIAKNGTGSSVARLRSSGITATRVDELVATLRWP